MPEIRDPEALRAVIAPKTLGNMRELGVRTVEAVCALCGHVGVADVRDLPDDLPVPDVADQITCTACGGKAASVRPNWLEHQASGAEGRPAG